MWASGASSKHCRTHLSMTNIYNASKCLIETLTFVISIIHIFRTKQNVENSVSLCLQMWHWLCFSSSDCPLRPLALIIKSEFPEWRLAIHRIFNKYSSNWNGIHLRNCKASWFAKWITVKFIKRCISVDIQCVFVWMQLKSN